MSDVEIAAEEFPHQIGIGMPGIEQGNPILQLVPLFLQLRDMGIALVQQLQILAPSQCSARPEEGHCGQQKQHRKSKALQQFFARRTDQGFRLRHAAKESQLEFEHK